MFERFSRSLSLVKASSAVLSANKRLMVFPVLSSICTLIVAASFLVPAFASGMLGHFGRGHMTPGMAVLAFLFYLVQYFVIIFFNSALVGAASIHLRGGNPTVSDGFGIAMSKLPAILGYAVISATVGMVLRAIQERAGFIGRWVVGLLGVAWTLATFLVVPVICLAQFSRFLDWIGVDGLVGFVSRLPGTVAKLARPIQNGLVQFYALSMMLATAMLLWALLVRPGW